MGLMGQIYGAIYKYTTNYYCISHPPSNSRWGLIHIEFVKIEMMLFLCLSFGEEVSHLKFRSNICEIYRGLLAMVMTVHKVVSFCFSVNHISSSQYKFF